MPVKILYVFGFLLLAFTASAQKTRSELEKERASIQQEIENIRKTLNETTKNRKSSLAQLALLQRKLKLREKAVSNVNQEIRVINNDMYLSALEIRKLKGELDTLKAQYAESLVYAYKNRSNYDFMNFLFSATNFNDAVKRVAYLKSYRSYREKQAENIANTQNLLQSKIDGLKNTRKEKDEVLAAATKEKEVLAEEKKEQDKVVAGFRSKEKELNREIANKRAQDKKLQSSISAVIRRELEAARLEERKRQEEAKKLAAAKAAAEKAANAGTSNSNATKDVVKNEVPEKKTNPVTNTESSAPKRARSDFEMTPEGVISSTNFEKNRGSLPWPVETGTLVYGFGTQTLAGTPVTFVNDGYTIHTPIGAPVKAIFDGEVSSVYFVDVNTNSQVVIVKHGKYFTAYGGVTNPTVKAGQAVKTGQTLGRVVTNDEGVGELEFRLMIESKFVNPAQWLKSK